MTLIERVEAGETGRELDAEVAEAAGLVDEAHCRQWCAMDGRTDLTRARFISAWAPFFTTSIDDQSALPGRIVRVEQIDICPVHWHARTEGEIDGSAPTEAGARLAALLRGMRPAGEGADG